MRCSFVFLVLDPGPYIAGKRRGGVGLGVAGAPYRKRSKVYAKKNHGNLKPSV